MGEGGELIDICDDSGRHLGTKARLAVHRDGDWHPVFNCLVVRQGGREPSVLLQLRGAASPAFPNLLDLTVGGHLAAGEPPEIGGVRELEEELGLQVSAESLAFLGVRRSVLVDRKGLVHRELIHAFLLLDDHPPVGYRLRAGEVGGLFDCGIADVLAVLDARSESFRGHGIAVRQNGTVGRSQRSFTAADLVPNPPYWIAMLVMAERFALGRRPVAI